MEKNEQTKKGLKELYELGKVLGEKLGKRKEGTVFKLLNTIRAGNWEKFQESMLHLIAMASGGDQKKLEEVLKNIIQNRSKDHAHAFILGIIAGGEENGEQ